MKILSISDYYDYRCALQQLAVNTEKLKFMSYTKFNTSERSEDFMHQLLALHQKIHRAQADVNCQSQVFEDTCDLFQRTVGLTLFTVTAVHPDNSCVVRLYSNQQEKYADQGTKPIEHDAWHKKVMLQGETFYAANLEELKPYFSDWLTLQSMSLNSVLNIPIMYQDNCIATVNVLQQNLNAYDHCDRHLLSQYAHLLTPLIVQWREEQR